MQQHRTDTDSTRPSSRRRATVAAAVALALAAAPLALAACGDDDDDASAGKAAAAKPPAPATLAIRTSDAGTERFQTIAPKSIAGGRVALTFTNAGQDPHEAQLVRIDGAHTPQDALKVMTADGAIPAWMHLEGGAGTTGPRQTVSTALNLEPGSYAMLDNADRTGPPNSARGALATFEVGAGKAGALPASTATITAVEHEGARREYGFDVSGLRVGVNRLRFANEGDEPHHVVMFPILPGRTLEDVEKAFASDRPTGPPPVDYARSAGTSVLDGKTTEITDLSLRKRGRYALLCFLTDRDGKGKPHFLRGMTKEVEVH
jgi:plastocyanin